MTSLLAFAIPAFLLITNSFTGTFPPAPAFSPALVEPYQPPADIVQLADAAGMTDEARQIFYGAAPVIVTDQATFQAACSTHPMDGTVELGCYTSDHHIYLLDIPDPRLRSGLVMAAAHEMLHAAYVQLPAADRASISPLLETQAADLADPSLNNRLATYEITEPGQNSNELHSILGTEFAPLSTDLEKYYSRYFTDRNVIVSNAQAFHGVFTDLSARLADLANQIHQLEDQVNADRANGDSEAYNRHADQLRALIDQYNQVVIEYNSLAAELTGEKVTSAQP